MLIIKNKIKIKKLKKWLTHKKTYDIIDDVAAEMINEKQLGSVQKGYIPKAE